MIASSLLAADPVNAAGDAQLLAGALLGIATVVVNPPRSPARAHPGSATLGIMSGMPTSKIVDAFTAGVGSTLGSVGLLIALGAMTGALLADSGSADRLVDTVASRVSVGRLPWAIAAVAALVGIPLFSKSASFWSCRFFYSSPGVSMYRS